MSKHFKAVLPVRVLLAMKDFVSSEETRRYICGVCIQARGNKKGIVAATNGHILLRYEVEEEQVKEKMQIVGDKGDEIIFVLDKLTAYVLGNFKNCMVQMVWNYRGDEIYCTLLEEVKDDKDGKMKLEPRFKFTGKRILGNFPDIEKVIPKKPEEIGFVNVNSSYFKPFEKAGKLMGDTFIQIKALKGETAPSRVVYQRRPNLLGVWMPVKFYE